MWTHVPPSPCRRFRQSRVLLIGCGDVGLRVARSLLPRVRVLALTSSPERVPALRALGVMPLQGNLDDPTSLARLAGLAPTVLYLAPPPPQGPRDTRTAHLQVALARRGRVQRLVYGSTTGVYGDAGGARFDETRPVAPATDRARRRVDAERVLRRWGRRLPWGCGPRVTVLRIPGIYAFDREGGDPRDRLRRGAPLLQAQDDVYTNHIHADDLARACALAVWRGPVQRVLHVSDGTDTLMGDHFDRVADLAGWPRLARLSRAEAFARLTPMQQSFMSESRRLANERVLRELRLQLRYPTIEAAWRAGPGAP